jgi:hypothetical protein
MVPVFIGATLFVGGFCGDLIESVLSRAKCNIIKGCIAKY